MQGAMCHAAQQDAQQRLVVVVVELEGVLELEAPREAGVAAAEEGFHLLAVAEQQHAPGMQGDVGRYGEMWGDVGRCR